MGQKNSVRNKKKSTVYIDVLHKNGSIVHRNEYINEMSAIEDVLRKFAVEFCNMLGQKFELTEVQINGLITTKTVINDIYFNSYNRIV